MNVEYAHPNTFTFKAHQSPELLSQFTAKAMDPASELEVLFLQDSRSQKRVGRQIREMHRQKRRDKLAQAVDKMKEAANMRLLSAGLNALVSVATAAVSAVLTPVSSAASAGNNILGATASQTASKAASLCNLGPTGVLSGLSTQFATHVGLEALAPSLGSGLLYQLAAKGIEAGFNKFNPADYLAAECDGKSEMLKLDSQEAGEDAQEIQHWLDSARETERKMIEHLESMENNEHRLNMELLRQ